MVHKLQTDSVVDAESIGLITQVAGELSDAVSTGKRRRFTPVLRC